jgi:hypothetical protein
MPKVRNAQRLCCRIATGKKYRADHHRHRKTVNVKIVELDGGADEGGEGDARGGSCCH